LMLRAGIMQFKVIAEIIPAFRLLSHHSFAGWRLKRSAVGQLFCEDPYETMETLYT